MHSHLCLTFLAGNSRLARPAANDVCKENDEKVNNYRNFMMTLELIGQLTSITRVLVIPASQLSNLCNAINHGLQSHPKVPDWHNDLIQIHLHEPFGADYAAKAHAPMIKTLTTHLKERSNHLEMYDEDDLDPCDAAGRAVSDQLRPRRFRTLDAAFQALRDQKDAGTVAFNAKKFLQAAGTWTYAQHNIRFSTAEPWLHDKLAADDEKYAALTMELNYLIGINAAAAWLELAKADAKQRKYFAGMVEFVLSRTVLGPEPETWKPTQAQELKFLFRSGQAARMLGRYKKAFELVQGCAKRGPSDPIIQAEWKLLLREKGLGQLAGVDAGRVVVGLGDDSDSDWVILREDCAGLDFRRCQGGQYEACGCEPLREFHQLQLLALLLE